MAMNNILNVLYITIPAVAVLYGMFLVVKTFTEKELSKSQIEIKKKTTEFIIPNRLQAYERVCLLLERISVGNLVMRVNNPEFNVAMLHSQLLGEVRSEFNHNLSQQIYMSDDAWNLVKKAVEQTTALINQSYGDIANKELKGFELAKALFNRHSSLSADPIEEALLFIKREIRKQF